MKNRSSFKVFKWNKTKSVKTKSYYKITIIVYLLLTTLKAFTQISPGELTSAHAALEGMANCVKCHVLGESVSNALCLDCHKEIDELQKKGDGYHSSTEVKGKDCFVCHNEHHGRKFAIIRFEKDSFDHRLTGYELVGKHKETKCEECHKSENIKQKKTQKKNGQSYLGLQTNCLACHVDYHQETLGSDCAKCHNINGFKSPPGFDHQNTKFPLIGKHASTDCIKCHEKSVRNGKDFQKFNGLKFSQCIDCHKDEHEGKFGTDCLKCHNQESFKTVKNMDNFDHSKTNYPLVGKHITVDCKECHKQKYTAKIKHNLCSDCHTDYHKGQFKKEGKLPDCKECHTLDGFTPTMFTIERHNEAAFKLEGSHLATPCFACHLKDEQWEFRKVGEKCVDCHENIHAKSMDQKYYPDQKCEKCHNVNAWNEIEFDHNETKFGLEGVHADQTCRKCHFDENSDGTFNQKFSSLDSKCENCHTDIHYTQFKEKYQNECLKCHAFQDWNAEKFEHDSTRFKLDGGHKDVACDQCHKTVQDNNNTFIQYVYADVKCINCHAQ